MTRAGARLWEDPESSVRLGKDPPFNARWEYRTGPEYTPETYRPKRVPIHLREQVTGWREANLLRAFWYKQETGLANFPSIAGAQNLVQVAGATLGNYVFDLLDHDVFIARQIIPGAKHPYRRGEAGTTLHVGEQKGV